MGYLIPLYEASVHPRRAAAAAAAAQAQTIDVLSGCLVIRARRVGLAYKKSSGWMADCRCTKIQYGSDKYEPYHLAIGYTGLLAGSRLTTIVMVPESIGFHEVTYVGVSSGESECGLHLTVTADCPAR
jgi:hypothetical protein